MTTKMITQRHKPLRGKAHCALPPRTGAEPRSVSFELGSNSDEISQLNAAGGCVATIRVQRIENCERLAPSLVDDHLSITPGLRPLLRFSTNSCVACAIDHWFRAHHLGCFAVCRVVRMRRYELQPPPAPRPTAAARSGLAGPWFARSVPAAPAISAASGAVPTTAWSVPAASGAIPG